MNKLSVPNTSPDLLKVSGLRKGYYQDDKFRLVLNDLSFSLASGDSLAIVGSSGSGKTTLLLILAGLLKPDQGQILLNSKPVTNPSQTSALVLQDYGLLPWKSVRENILLGVKLRDRSIDEDVIENLVERLGIAHLQTAYPNQLSGGQRQRAALARAFLLEPELMLLDEPFSALDAVTRERLQHYLLAEYRRRKFGFIVVTHSIEEAVALGRHIMILSGPDQPVGEVLDNPCVFDEGYRQTKAYLEHCFQVHQALRKAA